MEQADGFARVLHLAQQDVGAHLMTPAMTVRGAPARKTSTPGVALMARGASHRHCGSHQMSTDVLLREVQDSGKAIGLLHGDGSLNSHWFSQPLDNLGKIFSNADQRSAFLDLLDQLLPPQNPPGLASGEKWHPLLGDQAQGNVYLTVADVGGGRIVIGGGGEFHASPASGTPSAALRANFMPLLGFGDAAIPAFPFAGILQGPAALQGWLNAMVSSGGITAWLSHLAGLFGATVATAGAGTLDDPWRVRLLALDGASSELDVLLGKVGQQLNVGLRALVVPGGATPPVRLAAQAMLDAIPLSR